MDLYTLADAMSESKNFVFFDPKFVRKDPITAFGFGGRDATGAGGLGTLPMYELVELLERKGVQQLTPDKGVLAKKLTKVDHVNALTERFRAAAQP